MSKIIQRGWSEVYDDYYLVFRIPYNKSPAHEIVNLFMCDEHGKVLGEPKTLKDCLAQEEAGEVVGRIEKYPRVRKHPTIIECCGQQFECEGFTNTCDRCGTDYNWNGSALAPRHFWGEETGEHYIDIVNMREPWDDNY